MKTKIFAAIFLSVFLVGCSEAIVPNPPETKSEQITTQAVSTTESKPSAPEQNSPPDLSAANQTALTGALELLDATLCEKITDQEGKKYCNDAVSDKKTFREAELKNDPTLCEKITILENREACKIQLEINAKKLAASADPTTQEMIIFTEATQAKNASKCEEIKHQDLHDSCVRLTAN